MTKNIAPLLALVATAVLVDGERRVIQPGQPLPDELTDHDRKELLKRGAAEPADAAEQAAKQAAAQDAVAAAEVQAERERVQERHASVQPAAGDADAPKPAAKKKA